MLSVSDAVKAAYAKDSGASGFYLTIDGTEYANLTTSYIQAGTVDIKESLTTSSFIDYASVEASELNLSLINSGIDVNTVSGKELIIKQYAGTSSELVPLGVFNIDSGNHNEDYLIKIVAYDHIKNFDKDVSDWWNNTVTWPTTPYTLLTSLCSYVGVTCSVSKTDLLNPDISISKNVALQNTTGLTVLSWIQEWCCVWFKADRASGALKTVKLDSSSSQTFTASQIVSDVDISDFTMPAYDKLQIKGSSDDIGHITGTGTNAYVIQENPLFYGLSEDQYATIGTAILLAIQGITYKPVSAKVMCFPYYEVGDFVTITTVAGKTATAPILTREMSDTNLRFDKITANGTQGEKLTSVNRTINVLNQTVHDVINTVDEFKSSITNVTASYGPWTLATNNNNKIETKSGKKLLVSAGDAYHSIQQTKTELNSTIEQTAEKILLSVSNTYETITDAQSSYTTLQSTITETANNITLEVSKKVNIGGVRNNFESESSSISITSGNIAFQSQTLTINTTPIKLYQSNGSDVLEINTTNFKVSSDGTITATNGNFSGTISASEFVLSSYTDTSGTSKSGRIKIQYDDTRYSMHETGYIRANSTYTNGVDVPILFFQGAGIGFDLPSGSTSGYLPIVMSSNGVYFTFGDHHFYLDSTGYKLV